MSDEPIRGFGRLEVKGEMDPIVWDGPANYEPRPEPPLWRRVWREVRWRVPHAWRVLVYGECDAY